MGTKKEDLKVVLDTNVLISALLFRSHTSKLVDLWKTQIILPFLSKNTFNEFRRVLKYPKFLLTQYEINYIIYHEVIPFFDIVEDTINLKNICEDPDDDKFLSCAVSAGAKYLISGDIHLLSIKKYKTTTIMNPSDFIDLLIKK